MPHVVNGIGTWYWGKQSLHARKDVCTNCRRVATLSSYDTTLCFVVLFIPLIPLRRYHVADDCSRCRHHYPTRLKDYQARRDTELAYSRELLEGSPSPEECIATIDVAARIGDPAIMREFGRRAFEIHASDPVVLARLARAYESLGLVAEAEECFRAAIDHEADDRAHDDYARLLMRTGRPAEAWDQVHAVLASQDLERRGVVSLAVRAFQAEGNHAAAIELLDDVDAIGPAWRKAIDANGYRRISEADAGRCRPIKSDLWDYGSAPPAPVDRIWKRPSVAIPLVALLALAALILGSLHAARHRTVYVVNGLGTGYTVTVNGITCALPPYYHAAVSVPEGELVIAGSTLPQVPNDQRVEIHTNFWTRLFSRTTFVLNPDRCAVLTIEDVIYTPPNKQPSMQPSPPRTAFGKLLHEFDSIEDEFTPPPHTVSVEASSSDVHRDVLAIGAVADWYGDVVSTLGDEAAKRMLTTLVHADTRNSDLLSLCSAVFPALELRELLAPMLLERPLNAEAHRHWQLATQYINPQEDLDSHYRALLAEAPDDAGAKYLLAMVCTNRQEAKTLLESSAGSPDSPRSLVALADLHASLGEWDQVLRVSAADPARCEPACIAAHFALGRFQDAMNSPKHSRVPLELSTDDAIEHAQLLVKLDRKDDASAYAEQAGNTWAELGSDRDTANALVRTIRAQLAIDAGDTEEFLRLTETTSWKWHGLQRRLIMRDWEGALKAAEEIDAESDYAAHAALYIVTARSGEGETSLECFERLVRALSAGDPDDLKLRDWLMGGTCTKESLANFTPPYDRASLMLATLATRRPDLAPLCSERGLPTAWNPRFPGSLAREVLTR